MGVAAWLVALRGRPLNAAPWLLVGCVLLATLPDLDLLFPVIIGEGLSSAYHRTVTHTAAFAIVAGLLVGVGSLVVRPCAAARGVLAGFVAFGLVASHLALDLLTEDNRPPYGVPLWWPLDDGYKIAAWTPFHSASHGSAAALFSAGNLDAVVWDVVWLSPIVLVCYAWSRRARA